MQGYNIKDLLRKKKKKEKQLRQLSVGRLTYFPKNPVLISQLPTFDEYSGTNNEIKDYLAKKSKALDYYRDLMKTEKRAAKSAKSLLSLVMADYNEHQMRVVADNWDKYKNGLDSLDPNDTTYSDNEFYSKLDQLYEDYEINTVHELNAYNKKKAEELIDEAKSFIDDPFESELLGWKIKYFEKQAKKLNEGYGADDFIELTKKMVESKRKEVEQLSGHLKSVEEGSTTEQLLLKDVGITRKSIIERIKEGNKNINESIQSYYTLLQANNRGTSEIVSMIDKSTEELIEAQNELSEEYEKLVYRIEHGEKDDGLGDVD